MPPAPLTPPPPAAVQGRFRAMIKPGGAQCNLDCRYCYYLPKQALLEQARSPRMSDEMLERHIAQFIAAQSGDEVVFSWQGGEPTLLGLDFFRQVVALQARYKRPGQRIENDLQTNGTLLDADWAVFLKTHRFLVGLSCDGPARLHDVYRVSKGGQPTHAKVVAAARLLRQHEIPFSVLCVVNRENARYPLDVYRFLTRELGARQLQLIPCVEPLGYDRTRLPDPADAAAVTEWSVRADDWGRFLCKVWDDWRARDVGKVFVNLFENQVALALVVGFFRQGRQRALQRQARRHQPGDLARPDRQRRGAEHRSREQALAQAGWLAVQGLAGLHRLHGQRHQRLGPQQAARRLCGIGLHEALAGLALGVQGFKGKSGHAGEGVRGHGRHRPASLRW